MTADGAQQPSTKSHVRRRYRWQIIMRRTHLLLAMFLMPWVLMYALSTIVMHHRVLLTGHRERVEPAFETVETRSNYKFDAERKASREEIADDILRDLGLEGANSVRGDLDSGQLTVSRNRQIGSYRISFDRSAGTLQIERQQFGWAYCLEMLHRRRGYGDGYLANNAWAFLVDVVVVAIILWGLTGLWMWLALSRTRRTGGAFLAVGLIVFCLLLVLL